MSESSIGRARQSEVYVSGMSGARPRVPVDFCSLQERAKSVMTPEAFAYIAGGAGVEGTMSENRQAFDRWRIVPRMLRDVDERDTSVELFGRKLPSPYLLAPIGVLEMAHRDADVAVAKAAASENVPMIFSNQASRPMCYGLAAGGEERVREVLRNYKADFDLTMGLSGCRNVDEIDRSCLMRRHES